MKTRLAALLLVASLPCAALAHETEEQMLNDVVCTKIAHELVVEHAPKVDAAPARERPALVHDLRDKLLRLAATDECRGVRAKITRAANVVLLGHTLSLMRE